MLKSSKQSAYFTNLLENADRYLIAYGSGPTQDLLHRFRVRMKRAEALLKILEPAGGKKAIRKHFKPLVPVFQQAGKIRESEINLAICSKLKIKNTTLIQSLKKTIDPDQQKLVEMIPGFTSGRKACMKYFSTRFKDYPNKVLVKTFRKKAEVLAHYFNHTHKRTESLHSMRKKLKRLLQVYPAFPAPVQRQLDFKIKWLIGLENLIGQWHDHQRLIDTIKTYQKIPIASIRKIAEKRDMLLKTIHKRSPQFRKHSGMK